MWFILVRLFPKEGGGCRSLFPKAPSSEEAGCRSLSPKAPSVRRELSPQATEGAWSRGGLPVRVGCRPGQKTTIPCALQLPLPSGTTCQLPPPLGEEAFWGGFYRRWSANPMATYLFLGCRRMPTQAGSSTEPTSAATSRPAPRR